jgi:hypothetical protein
LNLRCCNQYEAGNAFTRNFIKCIPHKYYQVIKLRRMRRSENVACIEKKRNPYSILVGDLKEEGCF